MKNLKSIIIQRSEAVLPKADGTIMITVDGVQTKVTVMSYYNAILNKWSESNITDEKIVAVLDGTTMCLCVNVPSDWIVISGNGAA